MHKIIIIIRVPHIILLLGSVTGYNHSPPPLVLLIPPLHWVYSYLPSTHWVYSYLPSTQWVYSSLSSTGSTPPFPPLGLLPPLHYTSTPPFPPLGPLLPLLHWVYSPYPLGLLYPLALLGLHILLPPLNLALFMQYRHSVIVNHQIQI